MMNRFIGNFFIAFNVVAFTCISAIYSQIPGTLKYKDIDHLKSMFYESLESDGNAQNYAKLYQLEANLIQNQYMIAESYYFLYLSSLDNSSLRYLDTLITYSKANEISKYLSIGYQEKGKINFDSGEFSDALDNYILALAHIDSGTRPYIYYVISHNIAIIKDLIGQKKEALEIYRENFDYLQEEGIKKSEINNYLVNVFALSHSFTENGEFDSASYYNRLGFKESVKYNKPKHKAKFILGEGYNLYFKMDYANSFDSIQKTIPLLKQYEDKFNLAMGYLFAAKSLLQLNYEYVDYLHSADSIIRGENRYYPQFVEIYDLLYRNSKETGNHSKQLLYLEKLIKYDNEIRDRFKGLYSTITKEYDQPNLLKEKKKIISELEYSNRSWTIYFVLVSILLLTSIFVTIHHVRRRKIYKKRFENLLNHGGIQSLETKLPPKSELKLSEELVSNVLLKMDQFEKSRGFLNKEISLTKLARSMETNSNYLSRIINNRKGKNYSNYINDLRVEYVLNELLENKLLRKYTIKAIAHEIGFRNAESFSSAFFKRVGLYPSFYIKELDKSV